MLTDFIEPAFADDRLVIWNANPLRVMQQLPGGTLPAVMSFTPHRVENTELPAIVAEMKRISSGPIIMFAVQDSTLWQSALRDQCGTVRVYNWEDTIDVILVDCDFDLKNTKQSLSDLVISIINELIGKVIFAPFAACSLIAFHAINAGGKYLCFADSGRAEYSVTRIRSMIVNRFDGCKANMQLRHLGRKPRGRNAH